MYWHYPHYGNQGGDPNAIVRKGDWKLIYYFEDGKNELYNLMNDIGETNNIFNKFPDIGLELKNELKKWLILSNAIIPEKDPLHNYEKEKKWLIENKQKIKLKLERKRLLQLNPNYVPNKNWWGSED